MSIVIFSEIKMRVNAETKEVTRKRILEAAHRLFAENGYGPTTTRDIARAAGIASGTVFNYFPTKEAIVACLASEAIGDALAAVEMSAGGGETLEEDLFALVAACLRKLKPLRKHLPALLESSLSPLAVMPRDDAPSFRARQLEAAAAIAARHGQGELPATALQLYWTLYTGILMFWASDESPKEEDTLALIDDSINMYVTWLREHSRVERPKRPT
jgi:AcrR family transcriptional regulator